jgi:electron transport complex protein RnfG
MNQIIRITVGLTISCLIAAFLMGLVFVLTAKAKKHNEQLNLQETMIGLLGYSKTKPAPSDLRLYTIFRYVIAEKEDKYLGYVIPVNLGKDVAYKLLMITLDRKLAALHDLKITPEKAMEGAERETALREVISPPRTFSYADEMVIAKLKGDRLAYLLPGEFQGFKTFIHVMLALDPSFKVLGLEIMEQEEDPGLGGEIVQDYFKNQFKDKSFQKIRDLKVIKVPLPDEYRKALEAKTKVKGALSKEELESIRSKYQDQDIYALTGATISSKAVTDGVKNMVKKFADRVEVLDHVIASQKVPAAF